MDVDEERWKIRRSGKLIIPAPEFGKWEEANQLPITQYFECARQAGLLRHSTNTSTNSNTNSSSNYSGGQCGGGDLYTLHLNKKPPPNPNRNPNARAGGNKRWPPVKEQKKQVKKKILLYEVTEPPIKKIVSQKHHLPNHSNTSRQQPPTATATANAATITTTTTTVVKPVDEDLYKITPDLLNTSKRKKKLGFLSCLVADCMV